MSSKVQVGKEEVKASEVCWYVKGIGLVKQLSTSTMGELKLELKEFK
jgi:hypothetical protein